MSNKLLKTISIYQIIGGILGILITAYSFLRTCNSLLNNQLPTYQLLITVGIYVFVLIVSTFSILSGFYMLKNKNIGFIFSIIAQFLQIPYLITPALIYYLVNGMFLGVRFGRINNTFSLNYFFHIGSTFSIYLKNNINGFMVGINIVPIIIIILLISAMRKRIINSQEEASNTSETHENFSETVESHDSNTSENYDNGEM